MTTLHVSFYGEFSLRIDGGAPLALPPSKKARGLLAYLILNDRPQRREHLCELFWELPNDPKGSLRWALSKLRQALGPELKSILIADRERVQINTENVVSDFDGVHVALNDPSTPQDEFLRLRSTMEGEFLGGLDLPRLSAYSAWLTGQRLKSEKLKTEVTARCQPDASQSLSQPQAKDDASDYALLDRQKIQFCKTDGGVTLAYASVGQGPPLVKAANWLTHLELDWTAPIWSPLYRELAKDFTFIRYDERGNGLSDWDVEELSQDIFVRDLECVVDRLGLDTFPLLGISQGAAVCIDYAIRHPERVSKLILFGGYDQGWRVNATPEVTAEREAMITLTRTGWGQNNPAYRHVFSSTFMPTATAEQLAWFNDFQRQTTSPENAVKFLKAFANIDVRAKLSQITVPTLVIHSRGDQRIDWTVGRNIAAEIPNAEFVSLDSENHLLLEGEPAAETFLTAVRNFLTEDA